jgi:hypothetical protein
MAVALAVLPLVVSAVAMVVSVGGRYHTNSDNALIELRVRDVGHHPVLLGPCCRDRWSHPGPALFYLLALPYRLTGSHSYSLALGALAINAAAIVAIAVIARRRGGTPLVLCSLVVIGLLMRTVGPDLLRDPWNPYVTLLPFALLILLSWLTACGDLWALPLAAGVASFLVQADLGYTLVAGALVAWGLGWLLLSRRGRPSRASQRQDLARAGLVTLGVVGVLWMPPLLEQATHHPGNMVEIARYFLHGGKTHSLLDGFHAVAVQLSARPEWLTGARPIVFGTGELAFRHAPLPLMLLPFAAIVVVLVRHRAREAVLLAATVTVGLVCAVVSVSQVVGFVYTYRVRWIWVLGMAVLLVTAWGAWIWLSSSRRRLGEWLVVLLAVGLLALSALNTAGAATAGTPDAEASKVLGALSQPLLASIHPGKGSVYVRAAGSFGSSAYLPGVVLQLERQGVPVRVGPNEELAYGKQRVYRGERVRAVLTVAVDDEIDRLRALAGYRLLAQEGAADRARLKARQADFKAQYEAGRLTIKMYLQRLYTLPTVGPDVGVFMSPAAGGR